MRALRGEGRPRMSSRHPPDCWRARYAVQLPGAVSDVSRRVARPLRMACTRQTPGPAWLSMGPGSACWCSGQSGADRAGAPCHATGYLHPLLPHVIFSLVDTQWVGCSRVLKPHPVLPPLDPLCISFVGTCFTAIVPSFSLVIAKANPPKSRGPARLGVPQEDSIPPIPKLRTEREYRRPRRRYSRRQASVL